MPRLPNPPREGHPGKPPRRRGQSADEETRRSKIKPHSYGQSAPMPETPEKVEHEHESLEELAGEPVREEHEDDPKQG
jgi:hypothetical protein